MSKRREKELVAMAFNQKEQRVLEKSLATLRLEMNYSIKLLDLHNRSVKVHFRQMKDKVSRIKSFLTPEEITKMRELEAEGKLEPMYPPVSLGSALKIAAAARRLGSASAPRVRAKSAFSRVQQPTQSDVTLPEGKLKRSNSITGVFIDVPPPTPNTRPGSAQGALGGSKPTSSASVAIAERTSVFDERKHAGERFCSKDPQCQYERLQLQASPNSSEGQRGPFNGVSVNSPLLKRPTTSSTPGHPSEDKPNSRSSGYFSHFRPSTGMRSASAFSSHHVTSTKDAPEVEEAWNTRALTPKSNVGSERCVSSSLLSSNLCLTGGVTDDSSDSGMGEDPYASRRAELLEEEHFRAREINRRKNAFLRDVDRYLREHPTASSSPRRLTLPSALHDGEDAFDENEETNLNSVYRRRRQVRVEFDATPTYLPEDNYRERLMGLWKDMNKCRYLRVPDELIDLSGINTLASENMKLFQVLRLRQPEPLSEAWKE
ncbi:hypothetical protein C0Q70_20424 [Pomacea canaliculata]|uniref:Uncharacterized protein n=2 Tax=Pomacea canaliculata TaxID=400727 RepID=A0A2T7NFI9_POMCA|nr:hypothetical protein C0Q70_20424 [Pomacea canaliculata]